MKTVAKPEMPRLTVADVLALGPCWEDAYARLKKLSRGRESLDLLAITRLRSVSAEDRLWLVCEWLGRHNPALARELAADFAESVLPLFERERPDDKRPREAIEVARRFARGEASAEELDAARAAAWAAAWAAADAARAAARGAARAAAWAADDAARAAAWAADDAADDAAWDAADAARAAAWAADDAARAAAYKNFLKKIRRRLKEHYQEAK